MKGEALRLALIAAEATTKRWNNRSSQSHNREGQQSK